MHHRVRVSLASNPDCGSLTWIIDKLITVLDTGASVASIPIELVTAIYSSIDGAVFIEDAGIWFVPCLAAPQVAVWFG